MMTVSGTTNEGPVTLLECHTVRTQMRMMQNQPVWYEYLQPIFVVKGADLGAEEPKFNRARVRFTNLDVWWNKRGIHAGTDPYSVTCVAPEADHIQLVDGANLTIGSHRSMQIGLFEAHIQQLAELAVDAPSLLPIPEFSDRYIQPFQDLITLACDRPSVITGLWMSGTGVADVSATRDGFVEVIGRPIYGPPAPADANYIPLFTAAAPPLGTEALLRSWYQLYRSALIPLSVLFSLTYAPQSIVDNRFLLVALVLESWHATLMNRPREDDDVFAAKKEKIIEQVDQTFRRDVKRALTNELPFMDRIKDLLVRVQPSLNELITDVPELARRFRDDRNDITHHHTGRRRPSGADMLELAETGTVIMIGDILLRLGFDAPAIGRSLATSFAYRQAMALAAARRAVA